jgi:hypothetical protein
MTIPTRVVADAYLLKLLNPILYPRSLEDFSLHGQRSYLGR